LKKARHLFHIQVCHREAVCLQVSWFTGMFVYIYRCVYLQVYSFTGVFVYRCLDSLSGVTWAERYWWIKVDWNFGCFERGEKDALLC